MSADPQIDDSAPTRRFSSRVADYVRARPGYPWELLEFLKNDLGLRVEHRIADVGSGTGILTRMLVDAGNEVYAIEPNADMRQAAEQALGGKRGFHSIIATAEATTLPDYSVDFVVAAQAFHWFESETTRAEFQRILKPRGWVVLIWNERCVAGSAFANGYEQLIQKYARDMEKVKHHTVMAADTGRIEAFFSPMVHRVASFPNFQELDFSGLSARVTSSSYMPTANDERYPEMVKDMRRLFDENECDGFVRIEYETRAYYGRLTE